MSNTQTTLAAMRSPALHRWATSRLFADGATNAVNALLRLRVRQNAEGELVCELDQCSAIDVTAAVAAPLHEGVSADLCLYHAHPAVFEALHCLLGGGQPVVVGRMPAPIREDRAE